MKNPFFQRYAVVGLAVLLLSGVLVTDAGYSPSRAALTHPTRSTAPSFNNYSDSTDANYSDERAFAMASKSDNTQKGDNLSLSVTSNETIKLYSYFDNTGPSAATGIKTYTDSFYQNGAGQYVTAPFNSYLEVKHYIKGGNTVPSIVTDTARITSANGNRIRLRYVTGDGNMRISNRPPAVVTRTNVPLGSQAGFFTTTGLSVGSKDAPLSGTFQAGDGRNGTTDYRVEMDYKVVAETANDTFSFTKVANKQTAYVGDVVQYTLSYTNNGPIEATNVKIVDTYDSTKFTIVANTLPSNCVNNGTTITCTVSGEVASGAGGTLTYSAVATDVGTASNTATLSSNMSDDQTASASVVISERPYTPKADTILESGTGATNWTVYDNVPAGATVTSVDDAVKGKAIQLSGAGSGTDNGWRLGPNFNNHDQFVAEWSWKISNNTARIYWVVDTSVGQKTLQYFPNDSACYLETSTQYITCGLGSLSADGKWYIHTRDLQNDLSLVLTGATITNVRQLMIRGNGLITDIRLKSNAYYKVSGNVKKDTINLKNVVIRFGTENVPAPVLTDVNGNYKRIGVKNGTYALTATQAGYTFSPASASVVVSGANATQDFTASVAGPTTYEDGTGATNWTVYDNLPTGASITNVTDPVRGSVVSLNGSGLDNGFQLGNNWGNQGQFIARWAMRSINRSNMYVYWLVDTNQGQKYLQYNTNDKACFLSGQYVICGLGSLSTDNNWYTHTRDLQADLASLLPTATITNVRKLLVRGNGMMDDISLYTDTTDFYTISGNVKRDGANTANAHISFGTNVPAPIVTDTSGNYSRFGFIDGGYSITVNQVGTTFVPSNTQSVTVAGSNLTGINFAGTAGSATIYEDGNDASDWMVYDNDPVGAISVLPDSGKLGIGDNSIQLSGGAPNIGYYYNVSDNGTGYMFSTNWGNNGQLVAGWDIKTTDEAVVYLELNTSLGTRYIVYDTFQPIGSCVQYDNPNYVVCGLPADVKNGSWHTISKDLQEDLATKIPDAQVYNVIRMRVRGNLLIDNVLLQ